MGFSKEGFLKFVHGEAMASPPYLYIDYKKNRNFSQRLGTNAKIMVMMMINTIKSFPKSKCNCKIMENAPFEVFRDQGLLMPSIYW